MSSSSGSAVTTVGSALPDTTLSVGGAPAGLLPSSTTPVSSVPGFLTKTFEIFSSPEYSDCCGWGHNGETILIRKIEQFSKYVLPKYFKHSNFQSFVRQLNMYDFHKTVQDPNHGEFRHEYFKKGRPELLVHIKRKAAKPGEHGNLKIKGQSEQPPPAATTNKSSAGTKDNRQKSVSQNGTSKGKFGTSIPNSYFSNTVDQRIEDISDDPLLSIDDDVTALHILGAKNGAAVQPGMDVSYADLSASGIIPENLANETGTLMQELQDQRAKREGFERRMEQKLAKLEGENEMLKRMFMESHTKNVVMQERMDRIMRALYQMFVVKKNSPAAITNGDDRSVFSRMPSMLLTDFEHYDQHRDANITSVTDSRPISRAGNVILLPDKEEPQSFRAHEGAPLMRFDTDTLQRLPSLDLEELARSSSFQFDPSDSATQKSQEEAALLLDRRLAGAELSVDGNSRINSFDFVCSTVSPPTSAAALERTSSLDVRYLPPMASPPTVPDIVIPSQKGSNSVTGASNAAQSGPSGRIFLEPGQQALNSAGVGIADIGENSALQGAPLTRQRTFGTYGSPAATNSLSNEDRNKRSVENIADADAESVQSKRMKISDQPSSASIDPTADEAEKLKHADLESSLNEAQEFMGLLNADQQTTLTRLDSLEMTVNSLLAATPPRLLSSRTESVGSVDHTKPQE